MSVVINRDLKDPSVKLFGPNGFIGVINTVLEFDDVRVQIRQGKLEGYYVEMPDGEMVTIDKNGRLPHCPDNLFRTNANLLDKLI